MHMEGLCTGASTDLRYDTIDYVVFIRKNSATEYGKSAEVRNFEYYRVNILLHFIVLIRRRMYGWMEGADIHDELTSICWMDGE